MSARQSFLSALILLTGACRCGEDDVTVPATDGVSIALWAGPERYFDRLEKIETKRLLIPWTDDAKGVANLRGRGFQLIVGLDPARTFADEWNRSSEASATLNDRLDAALAAGDELDGVHLDHQEVGLPDDALPAYLDATVALIHAKTQAKISYAIRPRTLRVERIMEAGFPAPPPGTTIDALDKREDALAWADAWAKALAGRVDRVVVDAGDGSDADSIELLANKLAGRAELWAVVDLVSPLRGGIRRTPVARNSDEVIGAINVLRSRGASVVLAGGGEWFAPEQLLAENAATIDVPPPDSDRNLEARANDANHRLRHCCIRDGQITTVYDHRYEKDHGDNLYQEDACWLTGLYTSAMSFKYAVTGDQEAAAEAREAWRALHQMANTTPLKGEVVRSFTRTLYGLQPDAPPPNAGTKKRWRRAQDRELYWVGDVSVDQLSGWFNGVGVYYDLVANEDEKREIAADVAAVLDIFLAHDLAMIEFTGEETTFGNLRSSPVLALAFFQIGFHVTGDQKYRDEYQRLIDEEGMHFQVGTTLAIYHAAGRFGDDHFYSSGFYPLISLEIDPARRAELELGLEIFHTIKRRFGDAYADTVYGVFHPELDASRRAMHEVRAYRPELLENANYLALEGVPHPGPFVPIELRPAAELDFDYSPPGPKGMRGGLEARFSGIGFMLSYWMARYHGLTPVVF